jgi:hypothetical protein
MSDDNNYGKMKVAEWRGRVAEKLDKIDKTVDDLCSIVRGHGTAIAVLQNERKQRTNAGVSRVKFWAAIIAAILAGPVTALIIRG